jgi:hypothetical protein
MSIISVIGTMLLVLVFIFLLCLGAVWMEKSFPSEKFDERQKAVRGRAYRLSFWVQFGYMLCMIPVLVGQVDGEKLVEPYLLMFGGFALQNLVFHVYCLINHSALPMSQKPLFTALGFLLCGILWLCSSYNAQQHNPLALVGHGSDGWTYLMVAFTFLSMALMHLIQLLRREKE